MGPTGAGKSNIIDRVTSQTGKRSGSGLESYTSEINVVRVKEHWKYGDRVVLVDTPGFDDTNRSDMEILQIISKWLINFHQSNIFLHGAMFLHRITDKRMDETRCRSLHAFIGACGTRVANNLAFVTTMWDDLEVLSQGEERERHLRENYWGPMIHRGASMSRFSNTHKSAVEILNNLLEIPGKRVPFRIQEEMIDQKRPLRETQAAKALYLPLSLVMTSSSLLPRLAAEVQGKERRDEVQSVKSDVGDFELTPKPTEDPTVGKHRPGLKKKALHLANIFAHYSVPWKASEDVFGLMKRDAVLQEHRQTSKEIEDLLQRAGGIKKIARPKKVNENGTEGEGMCSLVIEIVLFVDIGKRVKTPVVYGPPLPEAHSIISLLFDVNTSNTLRSWLAEQYTISLTGVILFDVISQYRMAGRLERRMSYIAFCQTFYDRIKGKTKADEWLPTPSSGHGASPGLVVSVAQVALFPRVVQTLISAAFDVQATNFALSRLLKEKHISLIITTPLDAPYRYRVAAVLLNRSLASLAFTVVLANFSPEAKYNSRKALDMKPSEKEQVPPDAVQTEIAGSMPATLGQKYYLDPKTLIASFCSFFLGSAVQEG